MLVRDVKKGMILHLADSGRNCVIQALEDVRYTDCNGKPGSYVEFNAVDLVSGNKFQVGAANPPRPYAPGLTRIGWACNFS